MTDGRDIVEAILGQLLEWHGVFSQDVVHFLRDIFFRASQTGVHGARVHAGTRQRSRHEVGRRSDGGQGRQALWWRCVFYHTVAVRPTRRLFFFLSHMQEIHGFRVLPVTYDEGVQHYMYIRPHVSAQQDTKYPAGRTLFVVNIPPDATQQAMRDLFRKAGTVEAVDVRRASDEEQPPADGPPAVEPLPPLEPADAYVATCSNAHVVFLDASSLDRALKLPARFQTKPYKWQCERMQGLSYLIERYRRHRPPHEAVKKHVDTAVARYSWIRAHPQWLMEQRARGDTTTSVGVGIKAAGVGENGELLDEDGFVIVQRGNKYGRSGGEDNTFGAMTPAFEEELRQHPEKKKARELEDFYRFQFREKKRQQFASLRAQFEADKQKIAQRKASVRFKPY